MKIKFTDGVVIETSGDYRLEIHKGEMYVVGHGFLCPVDSKHEAETLIATLAKAR